jgi:hypothetical protein
MKKERKKLMQIMQPGERSEYFEGLLCLRERNPRAFAVLSPSLKIAIDRYSENREKRTEKQERFYLAFTNPACGR